MWGIEDSPIAIIMLCHVNKLKYDNNDNLILTTL